MSGIGTSNYPYRKIKETEENFTKTENKNQYLKITLCGSYLMNYNKMNHRRLEGHTY